MTIIAELSSNHGGDLSLAEDMIRAAADSGATYAKTQAYTLSRLNPLDPQRAWLEQAVLDRRGHERLLAVCQQVGISYLSTPFDVESLQLLRDLGLKAFKIASSESGNDWWSPMSGEHWFVSYPWGIELERVMWDRIGRPERVPRLCLEHTRLTAIPVYPTPLEAVGRATLLDGWSDHTVGLAACQWALAQGVTVIEAHLTLDGRGRNMPWDKSPAEFRQLRDFADACETIRTGVSTTFRRRWSA